MQFSRSLSFCAGFTGGKQARAASCLSLALLVFLALAFPLHGSAQTTLGTPPPATSTSTITQGGPPNFADTYATPFAATANRVVFDWKAQFVGGNAINGVCAIATGIQLKVLRAVPNTTLLQVISAGQVHNPKAALQAKFGGDCPSFPVDSDQAVLEFSEDGLAFAAGDIVGLTIMSDPAAQEYFYPLVSTPGADTRLVLRNASAGDSIDLADPFTATLLNQSPAVSLSLGIDVAIDIKPGSDPNSINLGSAGVLPVAICSSSSFDATSIDPDSLRLAGASVGMMGKSGKLLCHAEDVNSDGLPDLVCRFEISELFLQPGDTIAVLRGTTLSGLSIRGQDSVSIVP